MSDNGQSSQLDYSTIHGLSEQQQAAPANQSSQLDSSQVHGQPTSQTPAPPEPSPTAVESEYASMSEEELDVAIQSEITILEELDTDDYYEYSYDSATPELLETVKMSRLIAQGNITEAAPLIVKTIEGAVQALKSQLSTINPDDKDEMRFLSKVVRTIYGLRKQED